MVAGFRRTISFPAPKSPAPPAGPTAGHKSAAYRARSASLPCRFHPLVLHLDDDVADLRTLVARLVASGGASAGSVAEGADQLGRVLVSLSELLHHPQAQDPLRRLGRSPLAERLLDDFLRLADAHGSFRAALVALAALQAEARAALRREDPARLASAARALRRSARDLPRIASSARAVATKAPPAPPADLPADAAAIAAAVVDAAAAVASASAAVFAGVSSLSIAAATARVEAEASRPCWMPSPARFITPCATPGPAHHALAARPSSMPRIWWVADLMRWMSRAKRRSAKKQHGADGHCAPSATQPRHCANVVDPEEQERKAAFERLDNLGRCIADVESSGEQVFRALVNARVSLLNILSPAF